MRCGQRLRPAGHAERICTPGTNGWTERLGDQLKLFASQNPTK